MDELRFEGRVALITGGGRGMGRAHALFLAGRGAKVVVNDLGVSMGGADASHAPAAEVVAEIENKGGSAVADGSDVSTQEGANAAVQAAIDAFGRIDIVVHNAGIVTFIPFEEMTYDDYRRLVAVHQDGGFLVAKAAWPHMAAQKYGRLVFITSLASHASLAHYASAKAALSGMVRSIGAAGGPRNIRANALHVIAYTRMMAGYFEDGDQPDALGVRGEHQIEEWWKDNLRPEQVSPVVAWLSHDACEANGETLLTGGGHVSRTFIGMTEGFADINLTPELVGGNWNSIRSVDNGFMVHGAGALEGWQFRRIISGGAPEMPARLKVRGGG